MPGMSTNGSPVRPILNLSVSYRIKVHVHHVVLICTDGLSNHVNTGQMVKICHENRGDGLVNKLVGCAKEGGGTDNITVTVIY